MITEYLDRSRPTRTYWTMNVVLVWLHKFYMCTTHTDNKWSNYVEEKKNEMKRNIPKRLYNNRYLRYWAIMNDRNNKKIDFSLYISCSLRKKRKKRKETLSFIDMHIDEVLSLTRSSFFYFVALFNIYKWQHKVVYTRTCMHIYIFLRGKVWRENELKKYKLSSTSLFFFLYYSKCILLNS